MWAFKKWSSEVVWIGDFKILLSSEISSNCIVRKSCILPSIITHLKQSEIIILQIQFSSVAPSCPTPYDPMNCSRPGLPVHQQLPEFTQTHVHWVGDAIQPSHPLSSPSPPAPNPSQHQSLFQWVNSSHEVAKVLEFCFNISPSNEHPGLIISMNMKFEFC